MAEEDNSIGCDCIIRNWSELPLEVLELILKRLAFVDIVRFKLVSSSWNRAAKSYVSGPFYKPLVTPWLMLPPERGDGDVARRFFSLSEQKVYILRNLFEGFGEHERDVIGSSYGWLVMWDSKARRLHLYNPISRVRIILPPLGFKYFCGTVYLSSDPSYIKIFYVVIKYMKDSDDSRKIAFHKHGDDGSNIGWTYLDGAADGSEWSKFFFHNSLLYGMFVESNSKSVVSVWGFGATTYPIKTMDFQPPRREEQDVYQHGLVESQGELLLVEMVESPNSPFDYDIHKVHITANKVECLKVDKQCLQERALILTEGGLQSISVVSTTDIPELETNSIYLAEGGGRFDSYGRLELHSEVKSYNLENKAGFKSIFKQRCTRDEHLFWILPNLCKV